MISERKLGSAAGWNVVSEGRNKVGEGNGFEYGLVKSEAAARWSRHQQSAGTAAKIGTGCRCERSSRRTSSTTGLTCVAEPINMSTPQMNYVNEEQPKQ